MKAVKIHKRLILSLTLVFKIIFLFPMIVWGLQVSFPPGYTAQSTQMPSTCGMFTFVNYDIVVSSCPAVPSQVCLAYYVPNILDTAHPANQGVGATWLQIKLESGACSSFTHPFYMGVQKNDHLDPSIPVQCLAGPATAITQTIDTCQCSIHNPAACSTTVLY